MQKWTPWLLILGILLLAACREQPKERKKVERPVTARFLDGPTVYEVKQVSDSLCRHLTSEVVLIPVIDSLIKGGADPNCECLRSRYYRKLADRIPIVRAFVRRKYREVRVFEHPLHLAAISGHAEVIPVLIEAGADPNERNSIDELPLEWALKAHEMQCITALLEGGADGSKVNLGYSQNADAIDTLMAHGGNGKSINLNNFLTRGKAPKARKMIQYGADLSKVHGDKLLDQRDVDLLRLCLEKGMSPDQPDIFGRAMIFETIRKNHLKGLKVLVEAGAEVNITDRVNGKTPLMYAAQLNREEALELLLDAGADLSASDDKGRTALHYAIRSWGVKPLEILLERDAHWPEGGESMLDYARDIKARAAILEYLEKLRDQRSWKGI